MKSDRYQRPFCVVGEAMATVIVVFIDYHELSLALARSTHFED